MADTAAGTAASPALRLLNLEQTEFERFLHDELGQGLVAIRSMAKTIDANSVDEIAELIAQVADDTYVEVYDRMMELRAESMADEAPFADAIRQCIDSARLESGGLSPRLGLGDGLADSSDPASRRLLLRSLGCLVMLVKRVADRDGELIIAVERSDSKLLLSLQLRPDSFPGDFPQHERFKRLENRLRAFGGDLRVMGPSIVRACMPCNPGDGA